MARQTRLTTLHQRKELVIFQAEAQRHIIGLEAQEIQHALRWVDTVYRGWQCWRPVAWGLAPLAGYFLARHGRVAFQTGRRLLRAWRLVGGWFKK